MKAASHWRSSSLMAMSPARSFAITTQTGRDSRPRAQPDVRRGTGRRRGRRSGVPKSPPPRRPASPRTAELSLWVFDPYLIHLISVRSPGTLCAMVNHAIGKAKRVALYVRVSTDGQTTVNQQRELESVAERHGWMVVDLFKDHAISGKNGREKRPAFDRMLQGVARKDFDLIAAWSVDRLGRSLQHLLAFLSELKAKNVDLYLHQQAVDTSTPAGRALFQMLGVFAEFERAMIVDRVKAGFYGGDMHAA